MSVALENFCKAISAWRGSRRHAASSFSSFASCAFTPSSRQWIENDREQNPNSPIGQFVPDDDVITFDNWELALQASWELDIFGAIRARTDSARQQIRSARAQAIAARLAVASNTAQGYLQLRALEGQHKLLVEGIGLAAELERIATAASYAADIGLECHAGHGLGFDTVAPVAAIPTIAELNIGHFLVGEAIFGGLESAVRRMRALMDKARADAVGERSA